MKETTTGEFSVFQFFPDETYECVRQRVSAKEAVDTAYSFAHRPAARLGIIRRVIITDGGDFTTLEWKYGEGVIFPPRAAS